MIQDLLDQIRETKQRIAELTDELSDESAKLQTLERDARKALDAEIGTPPRKHPRNTKKPKQLNGGANENDQLR